MRSEYHSIPGAAGVHGRFDVAALWGQFGIGSPAGLSVLDLGCNIGGWSIFAALQGARRVVGVDHGVPPTLAADTERAGVAVEFVAGDVCNPQLLLDETFDLVLCLSLLHGVDRPVNLIKNIGRWTKQRAIIESEVAAGHRLSYDTLPEIHESRPDPYTDPMADPPVPGRFLKQEAIAAALQNEGLEIRHTLPGRKQCRIVFDCLRRN